MSVSSCSLCALLGLTQGQEGMLTQGNLALWKLSLTMTNFYKYWSRIKAAFSDCLRVAHLLRLLLGGGDLRRRPAARARRPHDPGLDGLRPRRHDDAQVLQGQVGPPGESCPLQQI